MQQQVSSNNFKSCEYCGRPLPLNYKETFCPSCSDHHLFNQVKEYIRNNDVTEYDVALEFNIPLQKVKQWIREGRIEYKKIDPKKTAVSTHCKACGEPISFGTLCTKCLKKQNMSGHTKISRDDPGEMRYFKDS